MTGKSASWNDVFPMWGHPAGLPERWHDVLGPGPRDDAEEAFARAVEAAPKAELHVHLEAGVPESFYATLNARHGLYSPETLPSRRAPFASLGEFIGAWMDNTKLVRDLEVFEDLVVAFVGAQAAQGIAYTEAHVSPSDFSYIRERFPVGAIPFAIDDILRAYARGARRAAEVHPRTWVRFLVDALWIATPEEYDRVIGALARVVDSAESRDPRGGRFFVGVGLGGPEQSGREEVIGRFLKGARGLNLGVDIHSGENAAAQTHRANCEALRPDRVGHGIQGAAAGYLFPGHVTACPLSNLLTGSHAGPLSTHPVARMVERGRGFSVGSDDPLLFGNTLTLEFVALRRVFGWGPELLALSNANACAAAFDAEAAAQALAT
jgi:adenosine deaminase